MSVENGEGEGGGGAVWCVCVVHAYVCVCVCGWSRAFCGLVIGLATEGRPILFNSRMFVLDR